MSLSLSAASQGEIPQQAQAEEVKETPPAMSLREDAYQVLQSILKRGGLKPANSQDTRQPIPRKETGPAEPPAVPAAEGSASSAGEVTGLSATATGAAPAPPPKHSPERPVQGQGSSHEQRL